MKQNMYEAIGGRARLQEAVASFYKKVLADPDLRVFFARSNMNGVQSKQLMFLSMLLSGDESFGKPDIHAAHAESRNEGLTDAHFDKFVAHFRATLVEMGLAEDLIENVIGELESTRGRVLGR